MKKVTINGLIAGLLFLVCPSFSSAATVLTVTGVVVVPKVYDGNTTATLDFSSASLAGDTSVDCPAATLNYGSYSAAFNTQTAGTGRTVTVSGLTLNNSGACSLTQPTLNDGIINQKPASVVAAGVNKVYNANTAATVFLTSTDIILGDNVSLNYTGAVFTDANVGIGKTVSVTGITASGSAGGNYSPDTTASATADITPRPVAVTADDKVKALGAADPTLTHNNPLLNGDTFSGALARDAGEAMGTYAITQGTLLAPNYAITFVPGALTISDLSAPVITLNGRGTETVWSTNTYGESGATALDNVDGDLSTSIATNSSVKNGEVGTYLVTYNVTDANGNAAQITRTVSIVQSSSGSVRSGEVLGTSVIEDRQVRLAAIKLKLAGIIADLIGILEAEMAAASQA